jgi:hypothetical protein
MAGTADAVVMTPPVIGVRDASVMAIRLRLAGGQR